MPPSSFSKFHSVFDSANRNTNNVESYENTSPLQQQSQVESVKSQQINDQSFAISSTESTYLFDQVTMYIDATCKFNFFAENFTFTEYSNSTSPSLPVFISAIQAGNGKLAVQFLKQFHQTFPNGQIILYSLNIAGVELDSVSAVN